MKITALAGGVGAAKYLSGLIELIHSESLTVIVNTGDDFEWQGLRICPDLDTITYTLAGVSNPKTGWGVRGDTFHCLERLEALGIEDWFRIGDRDLATHIYRSKRLMQGTALSVITEDICARSHIRARILPMTDCAVPTIVQTDEGLLEFQDYFVRRQHRPKVEKLIHKNAESASPAPGVLQALAEAEAILVCPSNPFLSIGPILALPGIRQGLQAAPAKKLAITPIVQGQAIKGPTGKMLLEMGYRVCATSVAELYKDFLDIFVLDHKDSDLESQIVSKGICVFLADTLMDTRKSRRTLARRTLEILR